MQRGAAAAFLSHLQPGPLAAFPLAPLLPLPRVLPLVTPAQAQGLSHPLALILLLVLSYNSHLLTSQRQPSLPQPCPWEPQHGLGGHCFCQDFLAPMKTGKEK